MIKKLEYIDDSIYDQVKNFQHLTVYHTKYWHKFLEMTFGWKVKALINRRPAVFIFCHVDGYGSQSAFTQ